MENSLIAWTDHTDNDWSGCTKVSSGCLNCYAETRDNRWHAGKHWGKGAPRLRHSEETRRKAYKWNREHWHECSDCGARFPSKAPLVCTECEGTAIYETRARVFSLSLGDWLDDEVPIEWLADLLHKIHETPNLDWLLVTKRPEIWRDRLMKCLVDRGEETPGLTNSWITRWLDGEPPHNVWIGTTVEDQSRADERITRLLEIPARVRFLSVEPMLEAVDLERFGEWAEPQDGGYFYLDGIHWVICGGESGKDARPFDIAWARDLRDQCKAAAVPFFMKQLGSNAGVLESGPISIFGDSEPGFTSFKTKHPKGEDPAEWPEDLRVQEFPR